MSWKVTANDIRTWTETHKRDAEETLPLLFLKLLLATSTCKNLSIPSGDSIAMGGWDGVVEIETGNPIIPDGKLIIEFGTNHNIHAKANSDYQKRTDTPNGLDPSQHIFCFVTTQAWARKNGFEIEKNKENNWKYVKGINADDLEILLDLSPAVHRWFARFIGKRPPNILDIEQGYNRWSQQTKINLIPDLVLTNRDEQIETLSNYLSQEPSKIIISSQREQESFAFIIAVLKQNLAYNSKALIVTNQEEWNNLIETKYSLILIAQHFIPSGIGTAISNGHFVIEASENVEPQKGSLVIQLPMIKKTQKVTILESMGFGRDEAWKIYNDTKGYLHAIIKHPLLKPLERTKPQWVEKYDISILSTLFFINSWNESNVSDKAIIESLSGEPYEKFVEKLYVLKNEKETPIRLIGNVWQVISKINLWSEIEYRIPSTQFNKLEQVVFNVFTEIDPKFNVPVQDRWMAYDKNLQYSNLLRESLADTLILLSIWTKNSELNLKGWIGKVFNHNINVEAWFSYGHQLILLAEASPESFLDALEKALNPIETSHLEKLFEDGGDMGHCFHCNLLWALETVSWDRNNVVQVTSILARLCDIEIKSKISNTPFNSLIDIFLGWVNYSSLTHQEKIQILEYHLLKKNPTIGWKLLLAILPSFHSFSSGIQKPKYHDWDDSLPKTVYRSEYENYISELNRLFLEFIMASKIFNWYEVFENIEKLNLDTTKQVINHFISLEKTNFTDEIRLLLAKELRDEIHRHREFPSTDWAMEKELVDEMERAFHHIEPDRLIYQYKFLFDEHNPHILNPARDDDGKRDWNKEHEVAEQLRDEAMNHMLQSLPLSEIIELSTMVQNPGYVGRALANCNYDDISKISEWLGSENRNLVVCAKCYCEKMVNSQKLSLERFDFSKLNTQQRGELLVTLPFASQTFELLQKQHDEVQGYYWKNIQFYSLTDEDFPWVNWVLQQFLKFKHPMKGIDFFANFLHLSRKKDINVTTEILFNLLVQFLSNENQEELNQYDTLKVIEYLQEHHSDKSQLQQIEWWYIALNGMHPHYLEQLVCLTPSFFTQLISWVWSAKTYGQKEDEGLTQEQISNRATTAYKVLDKLSLLPGQDKNNREVIDISFLQDWVIEAKKQFKKLDRIDIGDDQIGKLLSYSPKGKDRLWPHEAVREVLEEFLTESMNIGFQVGKRNQRGVTSRAFDDGGEQEYELAQKYHESAEKLVLSYPRTSKILKDLGDTYHQQAKREDERIEMV